MSVCFDASLGRTTASLRPHRGVLRSGWRHLLGPHLDTAGLKEAQELKSREELDKPVVAEPHRPHEEAHLVELEEACDEGLAWEADEAIEGAPVGVCIILQFGSRAVATDAENESGIAGALLEPQAALWYCVEQLLWREVTVVVLWIKIARLNMCVCRARSQSRSAARAVCTTNTSDKTVMC